MAAFSNTAFDTGAFSTNAFDFGAAAIVGANSIAPILVFQWMWDRFGVK